MTKRKKIFKLIFSLFMAVLIFLMAFLGIKVFRAWKSIWAKIPEAFEVFEDPYNQYDSLLGWKHIPGKVVTYDSTGIFENEEVVVEINQSGFRVNGDREYSLKKPDNTFRVIAVGDSYTFGVGPGENTWPQQLENVSPNLEVINMGSCAYGVGQMYLWFKEDGARYETDLVILAVIADDLFRAYKYKWPSGHGKPFFTRKGGELVLNNVPVPERVKAGKKNFHFHDLYNFFTLKVNRLLELREQDQKLPLQIIEAFSEKVKEAGSNFLLVFLPIDDEYKNQNNVNTRLKEFTEEKRIHYLDLEEFFKDDFREDSEFQELFRPLDGHYSKLGNKHVAEAIHQFILEEGLVS